MQLRLTPGRIAFVVLAWTFAAGATASLAQTRWSLSPQPPGGRQIIPFFEGWFDNGDGTFTLSFGYLNRNPDEVIELPHGERNHLEPAEFDGKQPTTFHGSRLRGAFAVTIPAEMRGDDVWWHLTADDGTTYSVPGRARVAAYELDWLPRAHGSVAPHVWFDSESEAVQGPEGVWREEALTVSVGQPVTLTLNARDDSERDESDARFAETIPVRVVWSKYQGPPGEVAFETGEDDPARSGRYSAPSGAAITNLEEGRGTSSVVATFAAPGEYMILAMVDNWTSPDSSAGDQCCWTNAYVRVTVTP